MDDGTESRADAEELFNVLLPDTPLTDVLQRVVTLACRTVGGGACGVAGITVIERGKPQTAVFTDERSPRVDQAQYDADTGPCLDALRSGTVCHITDTATENRWRQYCDAALAESLRSTLSIPLDVSGDRTQVLGALNLYSETPDAFGDEALSSAEAFGHHAAIVVANAQAYWGAVELGEQLQFALETRATIEQAKGILMGREGLSPEKAFDVLVRASQRENRKLREIAADIVAKTQRS